MRHTLTTILKMAKLLITKPYIANPQGTGNYVMIDDRVKQIVIIDRKRSIKRHELPD